MARQLAFAVAAVVVAAVVASGCGSSQAGDYNGQHPDYARALAGSPPPLASLHGQAGELLPGGIDAYRRRVRALRGYPVVVNVWASWCGPCRLEFAAFQRVSARYGKRVAFLGVNSQDSDAHASSFLEAAPVPYPSYVDGDKTIANELGAVGFPATAFYDRGGKLAYLDLKPYLKADELRADVERYALAGGG